MADRVEVLITGDASGLVRATDQASSAMSSFGASASKTSGIAAALKSDFGTMAAAFGTASIAVSGVIGAFEGAARALQAMNAEVIDAERVSAKLTATFAGAEGAAARLTKQAEQLAGSTVFFDDDAIKSAAAALKAFDLTEKQIGQLLPAAVNLATVFGTDLDTAASKLALGLKGSTRGLREFGIVVKDGSDQSTILAEILKRGEMAAKGAAEAQTGLRGATEGLKKAQGEFNQALGTLLSGPQTAFLNFLSAATNGATQLANSMSGVAAQTSYAWKTFNLKTGKVEGGEAITGGAPGSPGMIPGLPVSQAAKDILGLNKPPKPPKPPGEKKPEQTERPRTRREDPKEAARRAEEERVRIARKALEDQINAAIERGREELKMATEIEDERDKRQMQRNEALSKLFDEEVTAAQKANDALLSGLADAGTFLAGLISGKADFGGLAKSLAGMIGAAFGGPIGSALAGAGVDIASAIFDRLNPPAVAQKTAADRMKEAADRIFAGSVNINEAGVKAREDALKAAALAAGLNASDIANAVAVAAGGAANIAGGNIGAFKELATSVPNGSGFAGMFAAGLGQATVGDLVNAGVFNPTAIGQALGGGSAPVPGASQQEMIQKQADMTAAFNVLVDALKRSQGIGESPSAQEAQQLGDSARNPVYVFDVSPSKDEFTRAPRGLFFRPVGTGRAVETGSAVSAGAVRGSAGTYGASPRRNLG